MKKIPVKYCDKVFIFLMVSVMVGIMSAVMIVMNYGIHSDFFSLWIKNYFTTWPIAFCVAVIIAPKVKKLVEKIVYADY